jgi:hypothetical protein
MGMPLISKLKLVFKERGEVLLQEDKLVVIKMEISLNFRGLLQVKLKQVY